MAKKKINWIIVFVVLGLFIFILKNPDFFSKMSIYDTNETDQYVTCSQNLNEASCGLSAPLVDCFYIDSCESTYDNNMSTFGSTSYYDNGQVHFISDIPENTTAVSLSFNTYNVDVTSCVANNKLEITLNSLYIMTAQEYGYGGFGTLLSLFPRVKVYCGNNIYGGPLVFTTPVGDANIYEVGPITYTSLAQPCYLGELTIPHGDKIITYSAEGNETRVCNNKVLSGSYTSLKVVEPIEQPEQVTSGGGGGSYTAPPVINTITNNSVLPTTAKTDDSKQNMFGLVIVVVLIYLVIKKKK